MPKNQSKSDIRKKRGQREKRGFLKILILWSFLLGLVLILCGGVASLVVYYSISKDLPKISSLADYHPSVITTVYADDGRKIAEFFQRASYRPAPVGNTPDVDRCFCGGGRLTLL